MLQLVPLVNIPAQEISLVLNNQDCTIAVYMRGTHLYADLIVNDQQIVSGMLCHTGQPVVAYEYMDFSGNLYWVDTQGQEDPVYEGIGTRFYLVYDDGQ